jgi:hypothetical protein
MLAHNETGFWDLCSENNEMIKYLKTNPVGVDKWIDRFQTQEQRELPTLFGVSETACLFYGRAEKVVDKKTNEEQLAVYTSGIKHEAVGIDTHYSFISYFILTDPPDFVDDIWNYHMQYYCYGDLSKLYTTITHRADEHLRRDVQNTLLKRLDPGEFLTVDILEELQPFHSFKINFVKHCQ